MVLFRSYKRKHPALHELLPLSKNQERQLGALNKWSKSLVILEMHLINPQIFSRKYVLEIQLFEHDIVLSIFTVLKKRIKVKIFVVLNKMEWFTNVMKMPNTQNKQWKF